MSDRTARAVVFLLVALLGPLAAATAQTSTLVVLKRVPIPLDGTIFPFTIEGDDGVVPFSLRANELQEFTLQPGTYTVREAIPEGWVLELARCGSLYQVGPIASGAVRFALAPGETVLCQFHNRNPEYPPVPAPAIAEVPTLSPTAMSVLFLTLSMAGTLLLRRAL